MVSITANQRQFSVGAEIVTGGVQFRVWAPRRRRVSVELFRDRASDRSIPLRAESDGYYAGMVQDVPAGARYAFRLDEETESYPDPASRFQPEGVHKPSEVIDPHTFQWTDHEWSGTVLQGQVLYELHIGTFTPEGTWAAAQKKLEHLASIGVTLVEVMPVAEFNGDFGWGYDGVYWFAPSRLYGRPDDFRAFVNAAHALGLGVILDVVYNHFGPVGNYAGAFSGDYIASERATEWGGSINYDGPGSAGVREMVTSNAAYWIREYHLDGLRLDATQAIHDESQPHILAELSMAARAAAGGRSIVLFAENESQDVRHVAAIEQNGFGLDGLWNDDFHHTCRVAATGHVESYYVDYAGTPQEIISALKWGYLYQGQWLQRLKHLRGTPAWHLPAKCFVNCLENHDQVANSAQGIRGHLLTSPGRFRALTALLILGPATPLLFMGQEFMASSPFPYFADQDRDIADLVREGRWESLRSFSRIAGTCDRHSLPDPSEKSTFLQSKLNWDECARNSAAVALHRDLLALRRLDPTFALQDATMMFGAVIGPEALLLRWAYNTHDDRLLLVNLGRDFHWFPSAEPLIAPPAHTTWKMLWSSDEPTYGGPGTAAFNSREWHIPGHAAIILAPMGGS